MIAMADLDPAGHQSWSGASAFASLGYAGAVLCMTDSDWYHHPEQRAGIFHRLRAILAEADAAGLPLFLMDDFAYPSATAGGEIVRRNPDHRAKGLFFVLFKGGWVGHIEGADFFVDLPEGAVKKIFLLPLPSEGKYDLAAATEAEFTPWAHACYRVTLPPGRWHLAALVERDQYDGTYGDRLNYGTRRVTNLLDPAAMESYLDCIHRTYLAEVGDCFGRGLAGFFSEEIETAGVPSAPQVFPSVPWHDGLIENCAARGFDVYRALLALFLDDGTPVGLSLRYRFWRAFESRIDECCFARIRRFCDDHRVMWTGHMIAHDGPFFQIPFHGPLTRVLRRLHVPGTDFILRGEDALTSRKDGRGPGAKLVASTAWLAGCADSIAEANAGVDDWRGQRAAFTFHLAMGITIMNTFSWKTWSEDAAMARRMNAYVARIATFLKSGTPIRSAALLCPFGDLMAFLRITGEPFLGVQPADLLVPQDSYHAAAWELLAHQCDYAVVDEAFLQEGRVEDGGLTIGPGRFDAVLLPAVKIVEAGTWARLADFAAAGGKVIALGEGPSLVMEPDGTMRDAGTMPRLDLVRCASNGEWLSQCVRAAGPLVACEGPAEKLYVQARQEDGTQRWLLANLDVERRDYRLQFAPCANLVVYDPWSAAVEERAADAEGRVVIAIDGGAAVIVEHHGSADVERSGS
jgi:hypothetical protein